MSKLVDPPVEGFPDRTWAFRLIDFGSHVALHEVHYRGDVLVAYSDEPATFITDSGFGHEIAQALERALEAARGVPVIPAADLPRTVPD